MSIRIGGIDHGSTVTQPDNTPHGHSTYHLAADPSWFEPQRQNNFEFIVTGLEGAVKQGMTAGEQNSTVGNAEYSAQECLRLSVNAANIPSFTQEVLRVQRGNNELKYAGRPTFSDGSITVQDYIGLDSLETLYAWQALSYNIQTEKIGVGQDYKKTCYLVERTPDQLFVRAWRMDGCWVLSINEGNMSWNSDALHEVTATIVYDRAMIDRSDFV